MSRFEDTFRRASDEIRLSEAERARVKANLLAYQKKHPITSSEPAADIPRAPRKSIPSPFFFRVPVLASLAGFFLIASVSYAAEGSYPGDLFYPIKVSVNEEVKSALLFSDEAKASWDIARAERRLEEAETLAAEDRMTAEVEEELSQKFNTHTERAADRIARLEEKKSDEAPILATELETSLRAHEGALVQVSGKKGGEGSGQTLASAVRVRVEATSGGKSIAAADVSAPARSLMLKAAPETTTPPAVPQVSERAAQKMKERVLREEQEVREDFEKARGLSAEAAGYVETTLAEAHARIAEGDALFEAKGEAYAGSAFSMYQEAYRILVTLSVQLRTNTLEIFPVSADLPSEARPTEEVSAQTPSTRSNETPFEDNRIRHIYRNGTHRFYGTFLLPTACHTLTTDLRERNEIVTLSFTTRAGDGVCAQALSETAFDVSLRAPEDAKISVLINGDSISNVSIDGVQSEAVPDTATTTQAESETEGSSRVRILQNIISL